MYNEDHPIENRVKFHVFTMELQNDQYYPPEMFSEAILYFRKLKDLGDGARMYLDIESECMDGESLYEECLLTEDNDCLSIEVKDD